MSIAGLAFSLLRGLDPERAHRLAVWALRQGLGPRQVGADDPILATRLWGLEFPNPIGLAAGFDKDAEACRGALRMGFGFVEIGTVTPKPQPGNDRPRVFRLPKDGAVINRYGFNSKGIAAAAERLAARGAGIVGANIGRNRESADALADYAAAACRLAPVSDYLVINVSSPNTPGLRALQDRAQLLQLVSMVRVAATEGSGGETRPLLVKIAPDLTADDKRDIAAVAMESHVDGLIISNTTIERPASLKSRRRAEAGGLSGAPLFAPSTALLAEMYRLTGGAIPLIGAGGVADGAGAYAKIRAGASLVQVYTALALRGPDILPGIKRELAGLLRDGGFDSVTQAVGADHR
ncbi:MAG: quinone-dependent dihydroorotate dehydrogenase [Alphaproteobacteria bacterium]